VSWGAAGEYAWLIFGKDVALVSLLALEAIRRFYETLCSAALGLDLCRHFNTSLVTPSALFRVPAGMTRVTWG